MRTLSASLVDHPMAMLRGIAALRGIELTTNVRDDAAEQLAAILDDGVATAHALADCSPAAHTAWSALQAAGGRLKTPVFARSHGIIRPIGPARLEREAIWQQPQTPAEELWYRGLIFRGFADLGDGPAEYIYIPSEIAAAPALSTAGANLPASSLVQIEEPPSRRQAANSLAVDLCALLAALRETPAPIDRTGQIRAASDRARLSEGLVMPDALRSDLAIALARARGWLAVDRERLVLNAQAATAWLRATPWEQMTTLFEAWRDANDSGAGGWNDLRRIPGLQAEGTWRNDPVAARGAVLDALRRLEAGAWYAIADLVSGVKRTNPDFQRPDGSYTGWYLREVETGAYLSGFDSWDAVEGRLIRFMLTGPLFWLAAVALGAATDGVPAAFCLTRPGAAWLAGTMPSDLPRPARLSVSEQFVVSAPLLLPLLDRFRLLRFTEPVSEKAEPGQPTAHRITRGGLARARAAGVRGQAVGEFLQRASGGRVPPRVAAALIRWDQHGGAVRVTRGAVLRVEDANILGVLRSDPALAPLLGELISAQAVVVTEANLPKALAALRDLGYEVRTD